MPLPEEFQTEACLYAAGALDADERARFEARLEKDPALLAYTTEMQEVAAAVVLDSLPAAQGPSPSLKSQVLRSADVQAGFEQLVSAYLLNPAEAAVVTDRTGLVQWVNSAFTAMCGYSLDELRGRTPGSILQGPLTDPAKVAALRDAIRAGKPCCEELVNYHKDGHPYRVVMSLSPIHGIDGVPRGFVAIESEIKDEPVTAGA